VSPPRRRPRRRQEAATARSATPPPEPERAAPPNVAAGSRVTSPYTLAASGGMLARVVTAAEAISARRSQCEGEGTTAEAAVGIRRADDLDRPGDDVAGVPQLTPNAYDASVWGATCATVGEGEERIGGRMPGQGRG